MNDIEMCVVNIANMQVFDYTFEKRECSDLLQKAETYKAENIERYTRYIDEYPQNKEYWKICLEKEKNAMFEVMTFDDYLSKQKEYFISKPMSEVDEETWNNMLDILPPLHYCERNGVVMFCIMEMYTGTYTNQYAYDRKTKKYWTKMVDCTDPTTWIDTFLRKEVA